jgi:hypothetical protein
MLTTILCIFAVANGGLLLVGLLRSRHDTEIGGV